MIDIGATLYIIVLFYVIIGSFFCFALCEVNHELNNEVVALSVFWPIVFIFWLIKLLLITIVFCYHMFFRKKK